MTISYLFNCVTAFDEDVDCNNTFSDATEMAQAIEYANKLQAQEFQAKCLGELPVEKFLANFSIDLKDAEFFELTDDVSNQHLNVFVIYDNEKDIHYFFENNI